MSESETKPTKVPSINGFSSALGKPKFSEYQKIWDGVEKSKEEKEKSRRGDISEYQSCIFCDESISPREANLVIKKNSLVPKLIAGTTPPKYANNRPIAEPCCSKCYNNLNSSPIPSPRGTILRRHSSPNTTPRSPRHSPTRALLKEKSWAGSTQTAQERLPATDRTIGLRTNNLKSDSDPTSSGEALESNSSPIIKKTKPRSSNLHISVKRVLNVQKIEEKK